tara:strand:- start:131 stop:988 length:858 start_codon:yes stop_codon:yes gene_type:complete
VKKNILVTGATGLLGPYLVKFMNSIGRVSSSGKTSGHFPCNLTNISETKNLIKKTKPDIVLHAAALTNIDFCEKNPQLALMLNTEVVDNIIQVLDNKVKFIFISTDQVYPNSSGPHSEENTGPVNLYGETKLLGEIAALKNKNSLILRTNFFGQSLNNKKKSLSDFFINEFSNLKNLNLFTDVKFSPLHMTSLCGLIQDLINISAKGIYNVGSRQGMSKADFALQIANDLNFSSAKTNLIQSTELSRTPRTLDLRMDVNKIENTLDKKMPTLFDEIKKINLREKS